MVTSVANGRVSASPIGHPDLKAKQLAVSVRCTRRMVSTDSKQVRVPILMYHELNYLHRNSLGMAPGQFESEMEFLHQNDFHTITMEQLYAALYQQRPLPDRPILLTFDDGYKSVYTKAYPILSRYGYKGTVFMVTDAIGSRGQHPMLTWTELLEMNRRGIMDVQSHTVHHVDLRNASNVVTKQELMQSAQTLSKRLGHPVRFFCYPSGKFRVATFDFLRNSGYVLAVTEHSGYASAKDGPYTLHRIRIYEGMPLSTFRGALAPSFEK
jgi:peptidoglycan/xylan/chitin deacetylase (PgdA/CDA1 family)